MSNFPSRNKSARNAGTRSVGIGSFRPVLLMNPRPSSCAAAPASIPSGTMIEALPHSLLQQSLNNLPDPQGQRLSSSHRMPWASLSWAFMVYTPLYLCFLPGASLKEIDQDVLFLDNESLISAPAPQIRVLHPHPPLYYRFSNLINLMYVFYNTFRSYIRREYL